MSKNKRVVIISVLSGLSVVLDLIKEFLPFLNMPYGGSLNISLIPIVVCCFVLGNKDGFACACISFLISTIFGLNNIFLSIGQYIFDYIIPSLVLGFAGLFYKNKKFLEMEIGITFVMIIRTVSIIFSGAYYWFDSTVIRGSLEAYVASFVYNFPFCFMTYIMLLIIVPLIVNTINKNLL